MPVRENFGSWTNFLAAIGVSPIKWIPTKNGVTRKGTRNKNRARIKTPSGYVLIFEPAHPAAMKNGYVLEHRAAAYDNGILNDLSFDVHHINGVRDDNSPSNLEAIPKAAHTKHHKLGKLNPRRATVECIFCEAQTGSKYGLCRKHYKLQWQRLRDGIISEIHENPELIPK